jgi:hypothetical protein
VDSCDMRILNQSYEVSLKKQAKKNRAPYVATLSPTLYEETIAAY